MNITTILNSVDAYGTTFVGQAYQFLAAALTVKGTVNVAGLLLTLYVMFWGFGIWAGTARGGPAEYAWRMMRAFAIYAMATSWGDFQIYVYNLMQQGPSAIGNALLTAGASNTGGVSTISGTETALQNVYVVAGATFTAFVKNAGVLNFGGYVVGMFMFALVAILVGYAVFLIILAKLFAWLLLAVAPLFILMLLFGYTSRYFVGWLNGLVQYFMLQVLVYAAVAFYISITQTYFTNAAGANANSSTTLDQVFPIMLVSVIGILLLSQLPHLAAQLSGGIGIRAPSFGQALALGATPLGAIKGVANGVARVTGGASLSERAAARRNVRIQSYQSQILAEKIKKAPV